MKLSLGAQGAWVRGEEAIMGTRIWVELWADDQQDGAAAVSAVMDEMHHINHLMSPFRPDSELSRVNELAAQMPVAVGAELFRVIERSLEFSRLTDGVFDVTFSSVGHLYDYRNGVHPTDEQIKVALQGVNYRQVALDHAAQTVRFERPGMRIDLGGIAKGYAVEKSVAMLRRRGIRHAIVTAGGDSRVLGDHRGRPWMVGIRDPRDRQREVAMLPLTDTAISTSGDYERYFEHDGVRHHHILDPKTGKSPGEIHSVTIIGPDGMTTEGISTSVFVMGVRRGIALVNALPGIAAVIVDKDGMLHYSDALQPA
jgi:thiamine biosynthesis lipoprotein